MTGVEQPVGCEWFALCDRDAVGTVEHPILGAVPVCQRCADFAGCELWRFDAVETQQEIERGRIRANPNA